MKHLIFLLCLPFLLLSCDKKDLDKVEVTPVVWELNGKFLNTQRYIANLYSTNDRLEVMGMQLFSNISLAEGHEDVQHYMHRFYNVSRYKPPMNSKVFGGTDGNYLFFNTVSDPVLSGAGLGIDMLTLDPHFQGFNLVFSYSSESFTISENNVALVPYNFYDEQISNHTGLRYLLVKLSVENDANHEKLVIEETRILTPAEEGGWVRYMRSHQNNFYVATDWGFYKITEEGEINFQMPSQAVYASFEHKGNTYAIARHGIKQTHALFQSVSDQSWSTVMPLANGAEMLYYYAISEEILLASYNSQLFEVELGTDKLIVRELDNTGLEGHFITSIALVKDKVYIGTLSGLFSKGADNLLTYKEEKE